MNHKAFGASFLYWVDFTAMRWSESCQRSFWMTPISCLQNCVSFGGHILLCLRFERKPCDVNCVVGIYFLQYYYITLTCNKWGQICLRISPKDTISPVIVGISRLVRQELHCKCQQMNYIHTNSHYHPD